MPWERGPSGVGAAEEGGRDQRGKEFEQAQWGKVCAFFEVFFFPGGSRVRRGRRETAWVGLL